MKDKLSQFKLENRKSVNRSLTKKNLSRKSFGDIGEMSDDAKSQEDKDESEKKSFVNLRSMTSFKRDKQDRLIFKKMY